TPRATCAGFGSTWRTGPTMRGRRRRGSAPRPSAANPGRYGTPSATRSARSVRKEGLTMASIDRHPGGGWRARWRTPDGKSRSQVFAPKLDAERHLIALEHAKLRGAYVDPAAGKVTVAEYWADWSARQSWRESSRRS